MPAHWPVLPLTVLSLATSLLAAGADAADRTIYRCIVNGVATFSDRPCGAAIEVYSLESAAGESTAVHQPTVAASGPDRVATLQERASAQPVRARQAPRANPAKRAVAPVQSQAAQCVRLDTQLRQLSARMRAGYTVAEGERLRELQRTQRARRRSLHCK